MPDQKLLLASATKALKLDDDIALLKALAAIGKNWVKLAAEIDGVNSLDALLKKISTDVNGADVAKAFETVGLDEVYADLKATLAKVTGLSAAIPDKYKTLFSPIGGYAPGAAAAQVAWTATGELEPLPANDQYGLTLEGAATVAFDAAAQWPGGGAPAKLLKIGASGKAKAAAKATVPYSFGSATGQASASAGVTVGYYFDAPDAIYALAVAERLGGLADPFDLDSVWSAFASSDLEGIAFDFDGSANTSLKVGFADTRAFSSGVTAKFGFTADVSVGVSARYALRLKRTKSAAGALAIGATLSRNRVKESALGAALSIEMDISAITKPVVESLKAAVAKWDAVLKDIRPYLTPGTWLRDQVGSTLGQRVGELIQIPELRDAVIADLKGALGIGKIEDSALIGWLGDQIAGVIDQGSIFADKQADKVIDGVMAALQKAAPTLSASAPDGELRALVEEQVEKAKAGLKAEADKLLAVPEAKLKKALQGAGSKASELVAVMDDALKPVRDLLNRYDATIQDILAKVEEAAKKKVTARVYLEEKRRAELTVDVAGLFTGVDPVTSKVYQALVRGELRALTDIFEQKTTAPGFVLDAKASAMTKVATVRRKEGFDLVLLGFPLSYSKLVDSKVTAKVDGLGNVVVDLKGSIEKMLSTGISDRGVSFIDTGALRVAAGAQGQADKPRLELGIGASYADKTLEWKNIKQFVGSLAAAGLVKADIDEIKAVFQRWAGDNKKISGQIGASVKVGVDAVATLIRLQNRLGGNLTDAGRRAVISEGLTALFALEAVEQKPFAKAAAIALGFFEPEVADLPLPDIVLKHRAAIPSGGANPMRPPDDVLPTVGNTPANAGGLGDDSRRRYVNDFLRPAFALMNLVDLVEIMGDIYQTPSAGDVNQLQDAYEKQQLAMIQSTERWLRTAKDAGSLFDAEVTPWTVAFMLAMTRLAGVEGVTLTMTHKPASGPEETVAF